MSNEKKKFVPTAVMSAIAVHLVAALLLIIGFQFNPDITSPNALAQKSVEAQIIDGQALEQERKRRLEEDRQRISQEQERKRKLEEQKRAEQELKEKEEARKLQEQIEAQKKLAEQQRLAAEAQQQALEKQKQLEQEKKRLEEQRRAAEEERKRLEEQKRIAQERERKLLEEQKKREQERLQREKEEEQKHLASILDEEANSIAAEEQRVASLARERQLDRMRQEYGSILKTHIQSRWRRPSDFKAGSFCTVHIMQTIGGYIESVKVSECNGGEALRKSVEEAVLKSEPLPAPPDDQVFEKQLKIKFSPE